MQTEPTTTRADQERAKDLAAMRARRARGTVRPDARELVAQIAAAAAGNYRRPKAGA